MYQRILMPIDGSACSAQALAHGLNLAHALGAAVTFLYVVEDPLNVYNMPGSKVYQPNLHQDLVRAGEQALEGAAAQARARGVKVDTLLRASKKASPVEVILEAEQNADLTVMATHGRRGLDRLTLGSVTEGLLRRSDKPRLIVRCTVDLAANRGE